MRSLFFLVVVSFSLQIASQEEPIISWSDTYKLQWSDFQGEIETSEDAVASTASGLTFGYSLSNTGNTIDSFESKVQAYFYPKKSWYLPEKASAHILAHEQLHFDITELFARKFRKSLQEVSLTGNIKNKLELLHSRINKELYQLQGVYDDETNHSINKKAQKQWELVIADELKKLNSFRSKH